MFRALARRKRRRPSAAMIVALVALFVALGGPAEAARLINGNQIKSGTITGKQIKNRSIGTRDLSKQTVHTLQATPPGSVTESKLANGAVTPGKLAPGAVGSSAIAAGGVSSGNLATGSVGSPQVADGSLTGADIADGALSSRAAPRYSGRFSVEMPAIAPSACWSREPVLPELKGSNINGDLVLLTPDSRWPHQKDVHGVDQALSLTVWNSSANDRFVISACNRTASTLAPEVDPATGKRLVGFAYAIIDVP